MDNKALTYNTNIVDWSNPVTKDLFGAWRCNEGAGKVCFDRVKNNHGTLIGTYSAGKLGKNTLYNGSTDYTTIPHKQTINALFDTGKYYTISAMIKPSTLSGTQTIINKIHDPASFGQTNMGLFLYNSGTLLLQWTNSAGNNSGYISTVEAISANVWTHIAVVRGNGISGSTLFYINGVLCTRNLVANETFSNTPTSTYDMLIGYFTGFFPYRFSGTLADVLLWGRGLNQNEVRQLCVKQNNIYL